MIPIRPVSPATMKRASSLALMRGLSRRPPRVKEENAMESDDLFVVERLDNCRSICLSTLARQTVHESEASHLGGDRGFFIYEVDDSQADGGVQILAKAVSMEAAFRLVDIWRGRARER
jgi:hypothetical protein